MKLLLYDTKTISPEYCRPKDKEAKRKEHVCTKKIKVYRKKKGLHLQEQGRVYPFSEGVWLHRVPAWIFLYENAEQNVFVCYAVNGRFMKGQLLHWKIFGLLPINQKNRLKTTHVNCSYLGKNWVNYLLAR